MDDIPEFWKPKRIEALIADSTVADVVNPLQRVVVIDSNATISEALEILSRNRILSAPVCDFSDPKHPKCLGNVDMFDIIGRVLNVFSEDRETDHTKVHMWCTDWSKLEYKGRQYAQQQVKECINYSRMNPFCAVSMDTPLPELIYEFKGGVRRAVVVNESKEIIGIVTQSDIVTFLAFHMNNWSGTICRTALQDIGLGMREGQVITMRPEARAINCFHQMLSHGVSAVPIVSNNGELIATLSVSDLQGLRQEDFPSLLLPVLEYLKRNLKRRRPIPPLTVTPNTHFETVVMKLAATRVHRLWCVDESYGKPLGVVSLTDILGLLDLRVYIDIEEENLSSTNAPPPTPAD